MADNRKLAAGLMALTPSARQDLAQREEDIQRGKTVELLRRAGKEMYENPVVNTAIGIAPGAGDLQAGYEAYRSAREGDLLGMGLNAVGILPFIPALGGITKNIKPETLEQLGKYFDESAIEAIKAPLDYKSRSTTVLMKPNEFLAYAAKSSPNAEKLENIRGLYAQGNKIEGGNLPFLNFDVTDNVAGITGHEGRNRARYLQEQGVELMPVNIQSSGIRWSEQADPNRFDYVNEWPQSLQNQDLTMQTPFPLTREGEYISSMSEQQAMSDPFWRKEVETPKATAEELDALEAELIGGNNQPLVNALRDKKPTLQDVVSPIEQRGVTLDVYENPKKPLMTLSRIEVPAEMRGQGVGSQAMQDLVNYANQSGKTMALSPSTDFGATSVGRLKDFYKQFGFVENKGRNKDFSISESMYRLPEAE